MVKFVDDVKKIAFVKTGDLAQLFQKASLPQIALSVATGFGFGITLEAGLATLFGFATAGALSITAGSAVMIASLKMQQHFNSSANNSEAKSVPVAEDATPSVQIISHDIHNGDVIHLTVAELDDVVHHRFASDLKPVVKQIRNH